MNSDSPNSTPWWEEFRQAMPVAKNWAYFDHAAVAPLPEVTRQTIATWAEEAATSGDAVWPQWRAQIEKLRGGFATMIGAQQEEIALVRNTTEGIGLVAEGYPWQPGDNVVTLDDEFPSNQFPWMNLARLGVETRRVATKNGRVDLDAVAAACDDKTRIVTISWVGYATGWRNDVDAVCELAHRRGALLFLDAIQGLGVFPIDVNRTPIDFLAADGHKWLLGPEGAGVFYIRREHLDRLTPLGVGWNSVVSSGDYSHVELDLKPTAERYEGGSYNMVGLLALGASVELLAQYGAEKISQRVIEITDRFCERLEQLGAVVCSHRDEPRKSGIVAFETPGQSHVKLRLRCLDEGIVLSVRAGRLRAALHAYNNEDDIERFAEVLKSQPADE